MKLHMTTASCCCSCNQFALTNDGCVRGDRVNMGTGDEFALDILVNALENFSRECVPCTSFKLDLEADGDEQVARQEEHVNNS